MPRKKNPTTTEKVNTDPDGEILLKKEQYLKDFDIQVNERIKSMESELKSILADLNRMTRTEKLKISKDIRSMTIGEFLKKGGDLDTLDFRELSGSLVHDVSYVSPVTEDASVISHTKIEEVKMPPPPANKAKGTRKVLKAKREVHDSSLVRSAIKNTRTRKGDFATPLGGVNLKQTKHSQLVTPMITPKFDTSKPLTNAREPKHGETLVSLSGSPVVKALPDNPADDSNLVSISLLPQQTVLGGRLFLDENMSPNTLLQRKEIIEEAVHAINSRLEELNSQITASSKLEDQ